MPVKLEISPYDLSRKTLAHYRQDSVQMKSTDLKTMTQKHTLSDLMDYNYIQKPRQENQTE